MAFNSKWAIVATVTAGNGDALGAIVGWLMQHGYQARTDRRDFDATHAWVEVLVLKRDFAVARLGLQHAGYRLTV